MTNQRTRNEALRREGLLDQEKLAPLLRLKYHNSIQDAVADLGSAFSAFQRFLYEDVA